MTADVWTKASLDANKESLVSPKFDHIKTIREALDSPRELYSMRCRLADKARAALDSLEAELAEERRQRGGWEKTARDYETEIDDLRMRNAELRRLAPADSPPGDEARQALRELEKYVSDTCSAEKHPVWEALNVLDDAHLRSQQPESDDQRAELDQYLKDTAAIELRLWDETEGWTVKIFQPEHTDGRLPWPSIDDTSDWAHHQDPVKAQAAALAKARDAEGGES